MTDAADDQPRRRDDDTDDTNDDTNDELFRRKCDDYRL